MVRACLIYDFDKTLSPRNMQEYSFLEGLGIEPGAFWAECRDFALAHSADSVLAYMYKMKEKAEGRMRLTREAFQALGQSVDFFPGVAGWFDRVRDKGARAGLAIEHYIISSGLKEIIEGTAIARHFSGIFAASYCYGADGLPLWPANAVNYTGKTQYLFRINKGIPDVTNDAALNRFTPEHERRIPFANMIYLGDGLTDVPCMKLVHAKGGCSIAVHAPGEDALGREMLAQDRVDYVLPADYRENAPLERAVLSQFNRIARHSPA